MHACLPAGIPTAEARAFHFDAPGGAGGLGAIPTLDACSLPPIPHAVWLHPGPKEFPSKRPFSGQLTIRSPHRQMKQVVRAPARPLARSRVSGLGRSLLLGAGQQLGREHRGEGGR